MCVLERRKMPLQRWITVLPNAALHVSCCLMSPFMRPSCIVEMASHSLPLLPRLFSPPVSLLVPSSPVAAYTDVSDVLPRPASSQAAFGHGADIIMPARNLIMQGTLAKICRTLYIRLTGSCAVFIGFVCMRWL